MRRSALVLLLAVAACGDDAASPDAASPADAAPPDAIPATDRDIVATALTLDLTTREATAALSLAPGAAGARFEVGDLDVHAVTVDGAAVASALADGRLDVAAPAAATTVSFAYRFASHDMFDGWSASGGYSLTWPYFCGRLFPCDSRPVDGSAFTLAITGVPAGKVAVFPASIPAEAPGYMPAVAVGAYTYQALGTTTAGTEVGVYLLPGDPTGGVQSLPGYVDFFETRLGAYAYGDEVASVSVAWPAGAFGGMEHHPYWHIGRAAMNDAYTHAHEAAHGWFGNAIRIACWEDFVLSEGLATYLAARAIAAVDGAAAGDALWTQLDQRLQQAVSGGDTLAWPTDACNSIDILHHPVWSQIPYMKGAFFMRAVEQQVGEKALDLALRVFYEQRVGEAAGMQDLLDTIAAETGFDPTALATAWLRSPGIPAP